MVTGKKFYFPMDDRDSFIFLDIVGMRYMWSFTLLVTQLSRCCLTCSSLLPESIESLACHCQCMMHQARQSQVLPTHWSPQPGLEPEGHGIACALVLLLHRYLGVATEVGTAPRYEALNLLMFFPHFLPQCPQLPALRAAAPPHGSALFIY